MPPLNPSETIVLSVTDQHSVDKEVEGVAEAGVGGGEGHGQQSLLVVLVSQVTSERHRNAAHAVVRMRQQLETLPSEKKKIFLGTKYYFFFLGTKYFLFFRGKILFVFRDKILLVLRDKISFYFRDKILIYFRRKILFYFTDKILPIYF